MSEAKGVKELKEVIDLGISAAQAGLMVAKDGKVDVSDVSHLLTVIPFVGPGLENLGEIPAELKDLSSEEGAEIVAHVAARLSIDNAKAKAIALASIKAALANYELYRAIAA